LPSAGAPGHDLRVTGTDLLDAVMGRLPCNEVSGKQGEAIPLLLAASGRGRPCFPLLAALSEGRPVPNGGHRSPSPGLRALDPT
jgi:hypothetical protein